MITRFSGESRTDSIVNHFSFDMVEEDQFYSFMENMGYSEDDEDDIIECLHDMWIKNPRCLIPD